jgi:alkylhydroperoxidase/carboxymuconolactone decarboxylase family protein YurZ
MTLSQEQQKVKDEFIKVRGTWGDAWERLLELDHRLVAAYLGLSAVPWRHGVLDPKVKEFIYIAIDSAATHLYEPGIRQHIRAAISLGATADEIMEVLELTSTLGIHACNIGVPVLVEVLAEEGLRNGRSPYDTRREQLQDEFTRTRGYWHEFWEDLLDLDPDLFEAYLRFSALPWESGTLEPKVKEMIYVAFDASATHLYVPGLKVHMRNAVRLGATTQELMEVLEIASVVGIHAATVAAPILAEELQAAQAAQAPVSR